MIYRDFFDSPIGRIYVCAEDDAVIGISLAGESVRETNSAVLSAIAELNEYFYCGRREFGFNFTDITPGLFRRRIYSALRGVPYGEVITYGGLAELAGCPGSARAVGGALGANKLLIVNPCHRVVAANGVGGFAFGASVKLRLLEIEGAAEQINNRRARRS